MNKFDIDDRTIYDFTFKKRIVIIKIRIENFQNKKMLVVCDVTFIILIFTILILKVQW